jgi:hypothetical protein
VKEPGYVEADSVAHCGRSLAGDFVWSLTFRDILTTWTENRAMWNKVSAGVITQVKDLVDLMNDLYKHEWSLYQNHFCPVMKLIEKKKINSRYYKRYDEPKTPYQRVLMCDCHSRAGGNPF